MDKCYNVGDLRRLVMESSNEFNAKLGNNVESENKKNNDKAYKDAEKIFKDHYGKELSAPKKTEYKKQEVNRSMDDVRYDFEPSKEDKERVNAQALGYTSQDEMKNGIDKDKSSDYESNKKITKAIEDTSKQIKDNTEAVRHRGLTSKFMSDEEKNQGYLRFENKNVKTVLFKKTAFITEGHMISRIPDEFKVEGTTFKMKDRNDNEYLIEWSDNRANIVEHKNPKGLNESIDRMKELMNFSSSNYYKTTTAKERINEGEEALYKTLENARKLHN